MSTALYRRYRPDTFADLIGQEHVTQPLMAGLDSGRISHAYLFSGPRGCGKTTSARIMARCLNCAEGPTSVPCGKCESCRELATGGAGSLDVVEIDAASHNGVDDARELRERAAFAPIRDRFKIFILDEAHMVTQQGFNALLKVVEEPPPHIKFIFATTEPEKVIGTIRSRTHHYPFRLVAPETMQNYLVEICQTEQISVADGVLPLVVRAGGGSVRDTLSILDQLIGGSVGGEITLERATALLGFTDTALLDAVVTALVANDGTALFNTIESIINSGQEPRRFLEDLLQRLRDMLLLALSGATVFPVLETATPENAEELLRLAQTWGAPAIGRAANAANDALTQMRGATSPRLLLELLCARLLLSNQAGPTALEGSLAVAPAATTAMPTQPGAPAGTAALAAQTPQSNNTALADAGAADAPLTAAGVREFLARHKAKVQEEEQGQVQEAPLTDAAHVAAAPISQQPAQTQAGVSEQNPLVTAPALAAPAPVPEPAHVAPPESQSQLAEVASAPQTPVEAPNAAAPVEPAANSEPRTLTPPSSDQISAEQWQQAMEQIRATSKVAAALLQSSKARPAVLVKNTLIIAVERPDQALALRQPARLQPIYRALQGIIGGDAQLIICGENEVGRYVGDLKAEAPAPPQAAENAAPQSAPSPPAAAASVPSMPPAQAAKPQSAPAPTTVPEEAAANPTAPSNAGIDEQWAAGWGPVAQPGSRRAHAQAPAAQAPESQPVSAQTGAAQAPARQAPAPEVQAAPVATEAGTQRNESASVAAPSQADAAAVNSPATEIPADPGAAFAAQPQVITQSETPLEYAANDEASEPIPAPTDLDYYTAEEEAEAFVSAPAVSTPVADQPAPASVAQEVGTASVTEAAAPAAVSMETDTAVTGAAAAVSALNSDAAIPAAVEKAAHDLENTAVEPAVSSVTSALQAEPSRDDEDVEVTNTVGEAVIEEFFPGARIIADQRTEE